MPAAPGDLDSVCTCPHVCLLPQKYTQLKTKNPFLKTQQGVCVSVCVPMFISNSSREEVMNLKWVRVDTEGAGVWRGRSGNIQYPHSEILKKKINKKYL